MFYNITNKLLEGCCEQTDSKAASHSSHNALSSPTILFYADHFDWILLCCSNIFPIEFQLICKVTDYKTKTLPLPYKMSVGGRILHYGGRQVSPVLSQSEAEIKRKSLDLYKIFYRYMPHMGKLRCLLTGLLVSLGRDLESGEQSDISKSAFIKLVSS